MSLNFISELPQVVLAIPLSLMSGLGGYLSDVRNGTKKANVLELGADVIMALLVGILTAFIGQWRELPEKLIYGLIILLASNGDEVMALIGPGSVELVKRWFTKIPNGGGKND
ncbi:phage holin family protein [Enterobacter kobei]|uniref:phage holin family protein n=1 Tax=Enterobacter kobei TaxID=208224 RepID=UPI0032658DED